jgi:23S rRNA (uridine2552-2'-O)-methyltransferase
VSRLSDRRHRHDTFYQRAKRESYPARSIYKLEEIDQRFRLLRAGQRVLDLGCRPGSWLRYAVERVGAQGHVVGIDRQPLEIALPPNVTVVVGDVLTIEPTTLRDALPEAQRSCFHVVLSDMAPDTSGVGFADQVRSVELFSRALELADALGCPASSFVGKIFMGEGFRDAMAQVRARYEKVKTVRPDATRRSSSEVYLVATGKLPFAR